MNTLEEVTQPDKSRQFLTFAISKELFGMELHQTREILEFSEVTAVPLMPDFLVGVINLRGDVVPVIDLGLRLGREPIVIHKRTCIIIVELQLKEQLFILGLLADAANEVVELTPQDIEEKPAFGAKIRSDFVVGIAKNHDEFVILLNAEKALSPSELSDIVDTELNQGQYNV